MVQIEVPLTQEEGLLVGPPRTAINRGAISIHNPETARRLGFRGAVVGGSSHLNVFAPPLLHVFGNEWFERGTLSIYFLNTVVSEEQIQAVVERPTGGAKQVKVHARRVDDPSIIVGAGTASLGPDLASELRTRDLRLSDPSTLRIFKDLEPGTFLGEEAMTVTSELQREAIEAGSINEPLPWYTGDSPWDGPIACPSNIFSLMYMMIRGGPNPRIDKWRRGSNAMFGAIEFDLVRGPVFLDRPYLVRGVVAGVGESPKTEYIWWDATAEDENGQVVATLRHMLRMLKGESPLYPELARK